ncbi:MAG: hypothetical protein KGL39_04500 [Patescibacteria group bacterium]|nr:hypothetical protein [Patescibacteria group bacterium]
MSSDVLSGILSRGYNAIALRKGTRADAIKAFREASEADPSLIGAAQQKLSELQKVEQRCFVSRTQAEFLRQALEK